MAVRKAIPIVIVLLLLTAQDVYSAWNWCMYVDPDAAGDNDGGRDGADPNDPSQAANWTDAWTSLFAAEAYCDGIDWVTATKIPIIYCRSSSGTDDTTLVYWGGGTYNSTYYPNIIGYDFPSDGIRDDSKYILHNNDAEAYIMGGNIDYIKIQNIQFKVTKAGGTQRNGLVWHANNEANKIILDSCIFYCVLSSTGACYALQTNGSNILADVYNCLAIGTDQTSTTFGFYSDVGSDMNFWNCTAYGFKYGFGESADGTYTAKNCVSFNNADDFYGTWTLNYCATDDGDDSGSNGNITITQSADDWAALVTDAAAGDFSITDADSELYDAGTADLFDEDDDIIGTERPQGEAWDIGAFEYEEEEEPPAPGTWDVVLLGGAKSAGKSAGKYSGKQD